MGTGYAHSDYNYCEVKILLDPNQDPPKSACLDTGSGMSMVHADELASQPWRKRICHKNPIQIKGVGDALYESWETVVLTIYIPDESGTRLAQIKREFHIVSDLDCRFVIGTDVITPEKMLIDLHKRKLTIGSCGNMSCSIKATSRNWIGKHCVRAATTVTFEPHTSMLIPVRFTMLKANQDYMFTPYPHHMYLPKGTYVLKAVVKGNEDHIIVTNTEDVPCTVSKGTRIGQIGMIEGHQYHDPWDETAAVFFTTSMDVSNSTLPTTFHASCVDASGATTRESDTAIDQLLYRHSQSLLHGRSSRSMDATSATYSATSGADSITSDIPAIVKKRYNRRRREMSIGNSVWRRPGLRSQSYLTKAIQSSRAVRASSDLSLVKQQILKPPIANVTKTLLGNIFSCCQHLVDISSLRTDYRWKPQLLDKSLELGTMLH